MNLARLAELERRYDGPIPPHSRRAAELGSPEAVAQMLAAGECAFWKTMVLRQLAIIRARRADGSFYPALLADLRLYRATWRRWHRQRRALAARP